jgi:AcrR family transcriptional regulator
MARPKSENKRNAILAAAIQGFARNGLATPTSDVSKAAGVAEGTLFTYFPTKGDLVNAVYRDIKADLASAVFSAYPRKKNARTRLRHVWDRYVDWGASHPAAHRVLKEIELWGGLTKESRTSDASSRNELEALAQSFREQHLVRKDLTEDYVGAVVNALEEMTISLMISDPAHASRHRLLGFEVLWSGIAERS